MDWRIGRACRAAPARGEGTPRVTAASASGHPTSDCRAKRRCNGRARPLCRKPRKTIPPYRTGCITAGCRTRCCWSRAIGPASASSLLMERVRSCLWSFGVVIHLFYMRWASERGPATAPLGRAHASMPCASCAPRVCSVALFSKYACTPTTGRENFSRPVGAHQTSPTSHN